MEWLDLGLWGLFLATFLAATVLPFSSEAMLVGALAVGYEPFTCLLIATIGNTLGGITSYGFGYLGDWHKLSKWLRAKPNSVLKWKRLIDKYGSFSGLLCWLPFIGDVIAIALGLFKSPPIATFCWMFTGKCLRYASVIWLTSNLFS